MTTISAVLPTYNRAHTLERALTSVFSQTRLPDEVLVVDDGSTDATGELVSRFPKARLLRLPRNQGAAHARNEGVRCARGDFIAFLDSDDQWAPGKLAAQLNRLAARPDLGLLCTGIEVHTRDGAVRAHVPTQAPAAWSFAELHTYPFSTSTWMMRRAVFLDAGGFDASLPNCEDLDFLARIVSLGHAIEILPEALVTKYNQEDGLDTNLPRRAASLATLFGRHERMWRQAPAAAARTHRRLASMHARSGDIVSARRSLRQALSYEPWHVKAWLLFLLSFLGSRVNLAVRRIID